MAKRSRRGKQRPQHDLIYGRQAVREALRADRRHFRRLYLARGIKANEMIEDIVRRAQGGGISAEAVERQQLDDMLDGANHQGVALAAGAYPYASLDDAIQLAQTRSQPPLFLCLDRVQDPQNLGTLLRSAEACGVHGVILPKHRAAAISAAVVNASAGAVEHLLVCQETNLVAAMKRLKEQGLWFAGLEAHPDSQPFDAVDLSGPLGIVVGSEGFGLGRLVAETCDWLLELPMVGRINSLNAAVAGSILLFHVLNTRKT